MSTPHPELSASAMPRRAPASPWLARDVLGQPVLLKRAIMTAVSLSFYPVFRWLHPLTVIGAERLTKLPPSGVLFVSNHQTYFTDAIAMHQVFSATLAGLAGVSGDPRYILKPHTRMCYVAAKETMASGWIPRILAYGGGICVSRSWKEGETHLQRGADLTGFANIGRALSQGWVINFPQGTTRPFAPPRPGVAHMIRTFRPVVVPVVVEGFREAFGKTGLAVWRPRRAVSVHFKAPLHLDPDAPPDQLLETIMASIEQREADRPAPTDRQDTPAV
jgi:1-acyl-sn-glycerol-3-phosphate acyltransferase